MNRTQRAIKKQLHKAMNEKKREKRFALAEMRDHYGHKESRETVKDLSKQEKGLKKWHRQILDDYNSQKYLEVAGI